MRHPVGPDPVGLDGEPTLIRRALGLAAWPVLIAICITPVRFFLELAGVPTVYVFPIGLLWWSTHTWGLGSHYDMFDSWDQALIGQLFYGSLLQIIPGGMLGSLTLAIRRTGPA
jgi:hypothetical protein